MIYTFRGFSYFACEYVGRKSLDDFKQSVFSPSFMLCLAAKYVGDLRHEMKYDLSFFSFSGGGGGLLNTSVGEVWE